MGFGFKQPLVGEKRCVMTLIPAAKETIMDLAKHSDHRSQKNNFLNSHFTENKISYELNL